MNYWESRQNRQYYSVVKQWVEQLGPCHSIVDIGCRDTPVVTWGTFQHRYSVDIKNRPKLPNVIQIIGSWPDCKEQLPKCDVVLCLQVLEHLSDPIPFTEALFEHALKTVIISVPYKWSKGAESCHCQDPIDLAKIRSWTRRDASSMKIVDIIQRVVLRYDI